MPFDKNGYRPFSDEEKKQIRPDLYPVEAQRAPAVQPMDERQRDIVHQTLKAGSNPLNELMKNYPAPSVQTPRAPQIDLQDMFYGGVQPNVPAPNVQPELLGGPNATIGPVLEDKRPLWKRALSWFSRPAAAKRDDITNIASGAKEALDYAATGAYKSMLGPEIEKILGFDEASRMQRQQEFYDTLPEYAKGTYYPSTPVTDESIVNKTLAKGIEGAENIPGGLATAADFTGQVAGLLLPTVGAAATGGRLAGKGAQQLLSRTPAPAWLQKAGTGVAAGAGTGATLATAQEFLQELADPEAQSFGQHAADIGKMAGYFGAYGAAAPAAGALLNRAGQAAGRVLPEAVTNALRSGAARAPMAADIGRGVLEGGLAGSMVGAGIGAFELARTGDPAKAWQSIYGEAGQEMAENLVESIAFGIARRLAGIGYTVDPNMAKVRVIDTIKAQLPEPARAQLEQMVDKAKIDGADDLQANAQVIDVMASLPDGQEIITQAVNQLMDPNNVLYGWNQQMYEDAMNQENPSIPLTQGQTDNPVLSPGGTPAVANEASELKNLGGMSAGIVDSMYDMLWDKVQKGDVTEAGQPSALLQVAKLVRANGGLETIDEFKELANDVANVRNQNLTGEPYQTELQAIVQSYSKAADQPKTEAAPSTAQESNPPMRMQDQMNENEPSQATDDQIIEEPLQKPVSGNPAMQGTPSQAAVTEHSELQRGEVVRGSQNNQVKTDMQEADSKLPNEQVEQGTGIEDGEGAGNASQLLGPDGQGTLEETATKHVPGARTERPTGESVASSAGSNRGRTGEGQGTDSEKRSGTGKGKQSGKGATPQSDSPAGVGTGTGTMDTAAERGRSADAGRTEPSVSISKEEFEQRAEWFHGTAAEGFIKPTSSNAGMADVVFYAGNKESAQAYAGDKGRVIPVVLKSDAKIADASNHPERDDWHMIPSDEWKSMIELAEKYDYDLGGGQYEISPNNPLSYEALISGGPGGGSGYGAGNTLKKIMQELGYDGIIVQESVDGIRGDARKAGRSVPDLSAVEDDGYVKALVLFDPEAALTYEDTTQTSKPALTNRSIEKNSETMSASDFVITNELDQLGGDKTKFKNNIAALRTLHTIEQEERRATTEEQKVLSRYVGWGGLANAFDSSNKDWGKGYSELRALVDEGVISKQEYESARASTLNAHYTSPEVVRAMYQTLERMGFAGGRVLEPSMGTGNFFGLMPGGMTAGSERTGVEIDSLTGRIAKQLYPKADIHVKGFEQFKIPDGYFDAAIGNVPFGDIKVVDPTYKGAMAFVTSRIHNYFFVKSLDKVRDGGIVMFITSSGTLNARGNAPLRNLLAKKADFLGAVRLPSDAFKKNAGTEVTTDIVVLQKRPAGQAAKHTGDFTKVADTEMVGRDGKPMTDNEYFIQHPEMVLGRYAEDKLHGNRLGVVSDGRNLVEALNDALGKLPADVYQARVTPVAESAKKAKDEPFLDMTKVDDGGYVLSGGQIMQRQGDIMVLAEIDGKMAARIKGMIPIRDAARNVLRLQLDGASDAELSAAQKNLNRVYDAYVKKYGFLNEDANKRAFKDDPIGSSILISLEKNFVRDGDKASAEKEAIFNSRTIMVNKEIDSAGSAEEALVVSLFETGKVDFGRMEKLTGKTRGQLEQELKGTIFLTPSGSWNTADEYLSGNVRQKLRDAEEAAKREPRYRENVEALRAVQPEDLTPNQISVRLGVNWVPAEDIQQFIAEFLDVKPEQIKVNYIPQLAVWKVDEVFDRRNYRNMLDYNTKNTEEFGVKNDKGRSVRALDLIENALNLKLTTVTYNADDKTVVDVERTNEARAKQKQIQDIFQDWLWSDVARAERLTKKYNEEFNAIRLREYDGERIYGDKPLPGMTNKIKFRKHQKNAVWRSVQGGNTLLAHVVGAGKTFEMIASGMEMKRLGLINKPMYVVPNHLLDQWEKDFKYLYPGANILKISNDGIPSVKVVKRKGTTDAEYAKRVSENRANRAAALSKIAVGNYDAIIITHSTFTKLPMSPESIKEHIQEQIQDLELAIRGAKADKTDKRTVKQLENAKKNLEARIKENLAEETKDVAIPFEELGIDQIFVDESHMFKNLKFHTKMQNVAGLPQTNSQRAQDMFLKTQWLSKLRGGKGVVFATGTPISNTMAEMYTVQRYLQMDTLRNAGIAHFDAWAALFGETVTGIEMDATGKFKQKTRFARFHNVAELMQMFRIFADIQTADMLNLPVPKIVNRETVVVPMSDDQRDYLAELVDRAKAIKDGKVDPSTDNYLKLTGDGRKAALDIRMVRPDITKEPADSKVNKAVENISRIWRATKDGKDADGSPLPNKTQLVFLDMGTPRKKEQKDDDQAPTPDEDTLESVQVYDDLKAKLNRAGIPTEEIAFIHGAKTDRQRLDLFQKVVRGDVRVLIGSTEKMGAGMNVQERLIALHHLDAPWRPSDVEQREGRIVRQGNRNDQIDIFTYTTEGSFDAIMWDTLKRKATFIAQVMNGKANVRSLEDVEELVLGYAQVAAVTSGNPLVMEKFDVDQKVLELQSLQTAYERNKRKYQQEIAALPGKVAFYQKRVADMETDLKVRQDTKGDNFSITVEGSAFDNREEAGKALIGALLSKRDTMTTGEKAKVGSFAGFDIFVQKGFTYNAYLQGKGDVVYSFDINEESPTGTVSRLENAIRDIEGKIQSIQRDIESAEKRKNELQKLVDRPFDKADELKESLNRQAEILKQLTEVDGANNAVAGEIAPDDDGTYALESSSSNGRSQSEGGIDETGTENDPAKDILHDTMKHLTPRATRRIGEELAGFLDTVIRKGHVRNRAEGIFNTKSGVGAVRGRSFFDWRVIGHELGHAFSDRYEGYRGLESELKEVAQKLYPDPKRIPKGKEAEEGFAEFFRVFVIDPNQAETLAPSTFQIMNDFIAADTELTELFTKIRTIVDNDLAGTPIARGMGAITFERENSEESYGPEYRLPWWKRPFFAIVDFTLPVQDMMKAARKNGYGGRDLAKLMAISGDSRAKAVVDFESTPRDTSGRFVEGRALQTIAQEGIDAIGKKIEWKKIRIPGLDEKAGAFEIFSVLMVANRVVERSGRGYEKLPMTKEEAEDVLVQARKEFPEALQLAGEYSTTLSNLILEKLERADILTKEARTRIEAGSKFYIPFFYDESRSPVVSGKSASGRTNRNPVKRFTGKSAPVLDFFQATMLKLAETEQAIEYKQVLDTLHSMVQRPDMGKFAEIIPNPIKAISISSEQLVERLNELMDEPVDVDAVGNSAIKLFMTGGIEQLGRHENIVMNIRDGKPTYMRLAPDIFRALQSMRPVMVQGVGRALARLSRIERYTALATVRYITNAIVRDGVASLIQSKAPVHSLMRGYYDGVSAAVGLDKELADLYVTSGGHSGAAERVLRDAITHQYDDGIVRSHAPGWGYVSTKGGKKLLLRLVRGPSEILRVIEEAPRMAEYVAIWKKQVRELGFDADEMFKIFKEKGSNALPPALQFKMENILAEAAYASREVTTNFGLHGEAEWARQYIPTVTFLHGTLQGMYRFTRQAREHKLRTGISMAALSALSAGIWFYFYDDDEDRTKHLQDLSSAQRDKYWWVPIGDTGMYYAIAKPYEYNLPANLIERYLDWAYANDPGARKALEDYGIAFKSSFSVDPVNPFLRTIVELYSNTNSLGSSIIPQSESGLAKEMQYGYDTSQLARAVAKLFSELTSDPTSGVSPRKIDYFIKQTFGGYGDLGLKLLDRAMGVRKPIEGAEYAPFVGPVLYGQAEGASRIVERFYDDYGKAQSLSQSVSRMMKDGDTDKTRWATKENVRLLQYLPVLRTVADQLSEIRKEYKQATDSAPTAEIRRKLVMQQDYLEKMLAGLLYGVVPENPNPDAHMTDVQIQKIVDFVVAKSQKSMQNEINRAGGPSDQTKYLLHLMNQK